MPYKDPEKRRESLRVAGARYDASEHGRAARARYRSSEVGREKRRERGRRWYADHPDAALIKNTRNHANRRLRSYGLL